MIKSFHLSFAALSIFFLVTACGFIDPTGGQDFPTDLLLKDQDLPAAFVRKEFVTVSDIPNAKALAIGFVVPDGSQFPLIRVYHELAIYANEQSAQAAYPDREKEIFPVDEWKAPDNFQFKPTVSGDLYRFGCMQGFFNGENFTGCSYIQQHNNLISEVLFNLDGKVMKLENAEAILKNLDARLSQAK